MITALEATVLALILTNIVNTYYLIKLDDRLREHRALLEKAIK